MSHHPETPQATPAPRVLPAPVGVDDTAPDWTDGLATVEVPEDVVAAVAAPLNAEDSRQPKPHYLSRGHANWTQEQWEEEMRAAAFEIDCIRFPNQQAKDFAQGRFSWAAWNCLAKVKAISATEIALLRDAETVLRRGIESRDAEIEKWKTESKGHCESYVLAGERYISYENELLSAIEERDQTIAAQRQQIESAAQALIDEGALQPLLVSIAARAQLSACADLLFELDEDLEPKHCATYVQNADLPDFRKVKAAAEKSLLGLERGAE